MGPSNIATVISILRDSENNMAGLALLLILPAAAALDSGDQRLYFAGENATTEGGGFLELLDIARRMLAPSDAEFMTPSGCLDSEENAIVEGAGWPGNFWTQNYYGFGFSATPYLTEPLLAQLQTSYLWWFDHMGDGGQFYGGLPDVQAGMLCDKGSPRGCN